jgi:hypothetical protein
MNRKYQRNTSNMSDSSQISQNYPKVSAGAWPATHRFAEAWPPRHRRDQRCGRDPCGRVCGLLELGHWMLAMWRWYREIVGATSGFGKSAREMEEGN